MGGRRRCSIRIGLARTAARLGESRRMYLIIFLFAALVTLAVTPLARRAAIRLATVDQPDRRKIHATPMPLLGGVALGVGLAAGCILAYALPGARSIDSPLLGLGIGALIMIGLGLYDDRFGADAKVKLTVQTVAALIVVASGSRVDLLTNPLGGHWNLGVLSVPISVLWIVGITNALNLIDGLDGLAAGIGLIVSLTLFTAAFPDPNCFVPIVAIALAGSSLGFLRYNFPPARIFLGDAGSILIGFVIAVTGMQASLKGATAITLAVPLVAVGVPVVDTLLAILRRSLKRKHLFKADREHLHHRLLGIGLSHRQTVVVMYWVSIFLALTALSLRGLPPQKTVLILGVIFMALGLLLKALEFVETRFRTLSLQLAQLAREDRAPGPEEMILLNGLHDRDSAWALGEDTGEAAPSLEGQATQDEGEAATPAAGWRDWIGRPGTARRILERKMPWRVRQP
jgi:UDP-GlcNAc:undecaprenyl-phosphate GlcNAc-1-phosphate transferase